MTRVAVVGAVTVFFEAMLEVMGRAHVVRIVGATKNVDVVHGD